MRVALLSLTHGSGGYRKYLEHVVPLLTAQPEIERLNTFEAHQRSDYRAIRRAVQELRADVVFIPAARYVRVGRLPVVTMVRNMEPLELPVGGNGWAEAAKNLARAAATRNAVRQSARVIAVSGHVRDFLVSRWHVPEERIGMVYHGVDDATAEPSSPPAGVVVDAPFLFTAGSIRPARGLEDVIHALGSLPGEHRLVIAGSTDPCGRAYERSLRRLARERGVEARITWAGYLDRQAMSWCYRNASWFVMTSRAEACPNIVLEAMSEGAASISTSHAPMPEIYGDAALYYRERDAGDLTRVLSDALSAHREMRQGLRERAKIRAAEFSWEATARATARELQRAVYAQRGR